MKFNKLFAAAALLAAVAGAQAAAVNSQLLSFTAATNEDILFSVNGTLDSSIVDLSFVSPTTGPFAPDVSPMVFDDMATLAFGHVIAGTTYTVKLDTLAGSQATWGAATASNHQLAVSSVPEPGSIALVLAGAGVVGAVARRRQAA